MAFDFLGTLDRNQLNELRNFLQEQLRDFDEEINFLYVEMNSLEVTLTNFMSADDFLGGDFSSKVYDTRTQLPFLKKVLRQDDSVSAKLVSDVKKPFISTIKYKKERNEHKIKKLIDAIEQDKEMIDRKSIAKSETLALLSKLESMFVEKNSNFLFNTEEDRINYSKGIFI
jgi:hypothetical protein